MLQRWRLIGDQLRRFFSLLSLISFWLLVVVIVSGFKGSDFVAGFLVFIIEVSIRERERRERRQERNSSRWLLGDIDPEDFNGQMFHANGVSCLFVMEEKLIRKRVMIFEPLFF